MSSDKHDQHGNPPEENPTTDPKDPLKDLEEKSPQKSERKDKPDYQKCVQEVLNKEVGGMRANTIQEEAVVDIYKILK